MLLQQECVSHHIWVGGHHRIPSLHKLTVGLYWKFVKILLRAFSLLSKSNLMTSAPHPLFWSACPIESDALNNHPPFITSSISSSSVLAVTEAKARCAADSSPNCYASSKVRFICIMMMPLSILNNRYFHGILPKIPLQHPSLPMFPQCF